MKTAVTRAISASFAKCELTYLERAPIDLDLARKQHSDYEDALRSVGARVISLPAQEDLPDSVFVEDTAIVLDEMAVITRPGAASRRAETPSIATALAPYRQIVPLSEPFTLDGGDVLVVSKTIYVGLSTRTNAESTNALREIVAPLGYEMRAIPIRGCLHLKTAVTQCGPNTLLLNPEWVDKAHFQSFELIEVDPAEPHAANCVWLNNWILYPDAYPRTLQRLGDRRVKTVGVSELAKAEGAVTCCSLLFET